MNRTKTVKYYRIKSRFRFTVFIAAMITAIVALTVFIFDMSPSAHGAENNASNSILAEELSVEKSTNRPEYKYITVKSGDTLLGIAKSLGSKGNLYELVDEICRINNISSDRIFHGQQLLVPVQSNSSGSRSLANSSMA